ncbi:hypothetical protein CPAV1605_416 [seawater metagenome]|uniref:Uncharacterized protein n=1 Tax=seawater metagenome TaxID=1561972 RepID=A0A5E8CHJ0_9ZZZZ
MLIEINLKNLKYKILISLVIVCLFYVIYCTIPDSEFGRNDKTVDTVSNFERMNFTLERQFLISSPNSLYPFSEKAKALVICQSLVAWCVFIM